MTRSEALQRITQGVSRFQKEIYPERRKLFDRLRSGQEPLALFITCADSRVVPNFLTQTDPGEMFVERNPGNLVPPYSSFVGGVTASIEYAMIALRVPLIIICGHSDCGVMKAVAEPERASGMPGVQEWMRHALPARERLLRESSGRVDQSALARLTEYNVLTQMENLKTHPSVASRLAKDEVEIHGWIYSIADGHVSAIDPLTGCFEDLLTGC